MMKNIFIDCNIIIDWLTDRPPYSEYAKYLIAEIENKKFNAFISPLILAYVYYIVKQTYNKQVAFGFIQESLKYFNICDLTKRIVIESVQNKYKDFEEDIHYHTAKSNKIDVIITRNKKDFIKNSIKIMSADEFLELERDSS